MATSARIGVLNPDGSIRSVSCESNGLPRHLGRKLLIYFTDLSIINRLFEHGFVFGAPGMSLDQTKDGFICIEKDNSIKEFLKETQEDYFYIFNPVTKQWFWHGFKEGEYLPRLHMEDCK